MINIVVPILQKVVNEVNKIIPPEIMKCFTNTVPGMPGGAQYIKTKELVKIPTRQRRLTVYKKNGRKYVKIGKKFLMLRNLL